MTQFSSVVKQMQVEENMKIFRVFIFFFTHSQVAMLLGNYLHKIAQVLHSTSHSVDTARRMHYLTLLKHGNMLPQQQWEI